jgi:hypothetical protein
LAHSKGTKSLFDEIAVAWTAQDISSANIAGLPDSRYQYASLIVDGFEKDIIFVQLYSEFIELTTIYHYKTVSIRVELLPIIFRFTGILFLPFYQ